MIHRDARLICVAPPCGETACASEAFFADETQYFSTPTEGMGLTILLVRGQRVILERHLARIYSELFKIAICDLEGWSRAEREAFASGVYRARRNTGG
jgi:hypothetical protein